MHKLFFILAALSSTPASAEAIEGYFDPRSLKIECSSSNLSVKATGTEIATEYVHTGLCWTKVRHFNWTIEVAKQEGKKVQLKQDEKGVLSVQKVSTEIKPSYFELEKEIKELEAENKDLEKELKKLEKDIRKTISNCAAKIHSKSDGNAEDGAQ